MLHHASHARAGRIRSLVLCLIVLAALLSPVALAGGDGKTVRVGWYDSSFNTIDAAGRRSGYAYEYQMKIAAYTGWNYEYVRGSWPDLLRMLEAGEIDLMSDVSYTPEREERMLFPSLPMGTEEYYLFVAPGNTEISQTDYSTLNGKRVGVNKGSVQATYFEEWAQRNAVRSELVELTTTEEESLHMLRTGELDAYVTLDSFIAPEHAVPVCKIGASDFFFAVTKSRPDLLSDLNGALNRIQDENRYYNQQMYEKRIKRVGANAFLSQDEVNWLSEHGAIRVGYQDNYLSFCAADEETGELTGILKDYLAYASDCTANAHLDFVTTAYPTTAAALAALSSGEVDCVFPANLSAYDGEVMDLVMTPSVISTNIYAVVHAAGKSFLADREHMIVAVNEGNNNYDAFLMDNFPGWRKVYYPTTPDCLKAVSQELGGIAGRFEADRFDIYCKHGGDYQAIYDRMQGKLDGLSQNASIRIRMGVMPAGGRLEPEQRFDRARTACSMARGHYKEHLIVFDEEVRKREMFEQRLLGDLRRAVDDYQFEVYYQPKYDIQSEPPKLVSAEALIRWRHPELGMISPDDFIPLFERNGQIGIVDKYVWTEAARQIVRWREQYGVTLPVSVNLSRVDVFDPTLEETLDDILRFNGLDHDALKLEVTESAYTENADQVIRVVEGLCRKGYEVEMDDFGTGYSSLNMLSAMPIDVLKMDRAFIRNIEHDEKDIQLVALILDIAKNLKIPVIAEGVETEEQMLLLKNLGCELVQGYYFSRPLHPTEFENVYIRDMKADR